MFGQRLHGMLFFGGMARTCIGYDVSQTCAQLYSYELGLLPIDFYVTFDDFLTVAKCRLVWRNRDDIGVIFERWLDVRQHLAVKRAEAGDCGDHPHR